MKRQGGFTLIEMIVVIVILGILAVTAAPKFLNFQDDAKKASLQGLKGAIDGATGIVYGKAALEGKVNEALDSGIEIAFGYPAEGADGIGKAVTGLTATDWNIDFNSSPNKFTLKTTEFSSTTDDCVFYTAAADANTAPVVVVAKCTTSPAP